MESCHPQSKQVWSLMPPEDPKGKGPWAFAGGCVLQGRRGSVLPAQDTHTSPPRLPPPPDDTSRCATLGGVLHFLLRSAHVGGVHQESNLVDLPESTEQIPALHPRGQNLQEPRIGSMNRDCPTRAASLPERASPSWYSACTHERKHSPAVPANAVFPQATNKCLGQL